MEKAAHGTSPAGRAEAGQGTLALFGHTTCFFPDEGSSPSPLPFLLLDPRTELPGVAPPSPVALAEEQGERDIILALVLTLQ